MSAREFLDTNVLIYAHDDADPAKRSRARDLVRHLLRERNGVLSIQVLQEFFGAATRKLGMPSETARQHVLTYARFDVVSLSAPDVTAAIDLHRLHQFSIWDALIVRAALNGACTTLHTEDMQTGQLIENLEIANPFAPLR